MITKAFISTYIFLILSIVANAQNLPVIQKNGVHAPHNVKIDGQADEWENFQAYNKATRTFYTIANDDDNLYLAIKATDQDVIQKMTIGGVTLTLAPSKKELKKHGLALSYSYYGKKGELHYLNLNDRLDIARSIIKKADKADSLRKVLNSKLGEVVKTVEIYGVRKLKDSLLSGYNNNGVKVALRFDENLNCIYELAVPLKALSFILNGGNNFTYQIELNGAVAKNTTIDPSASGKYILIKVGNNPPVSWPYNPKYADILFPTNFTGEYTFKKKY